MRSGEPRPARAIPRTEEPSAFPWLACALFAWIGAEAASPLGLPDWAPPVACAIALTTALVSLRKGVGSSPLARALRAGVVVGVLVTSADVGWTFVAGAAASRSEAPPPATHLLTFEGGPRPKLKPLAEPRNASIDRRDDAETVLFSTAEGVLLARRASKSKDDPRVSLWYRNGSDEPRRLVDDVPLRWPRVAKGPDGLLLAWWQRDPKGHWHLNAGLLPSGAKEPGFVSQRLAGTARTYPVPIALAIHQPKGMLALLRAEVPRPSTQDLVMAVFRGRAPASSLLDALEIAIGAREVKPHEAQAKLDDPDPAAWGFAKGRAPGRVEILPYPPLARRFETACDALEAAAGLPSCRTHRISPSGERVARIEGNTVVITSLLGSGKAYTHPLPASKEGLPALADFVAEGRIGLFAMTRPVHSTVGPPTPPGPWSDRALTVLVRSALAGNAHGGR